MLISSDFDLTLTKKITFFSEEKELFLTIPNKEMIKKLLSHHENGDEVIIITYRNIEHESKKWIKANQPDRKRIIDFIYEHNLPITKVYFTNHTCKGKIINKLGVKLHYDDDIEVINKVKDYGIEAILVNT